MKNHLAVFKGLQKLVGQWSGVDEIGQTALIEYRMTANDTALVEDWAFQNGMTALTIYHMDGETLMAMHYCPIGNQPRLDLKNQRDDGTFEFECVCATHLESFRDPHEHAFDLRIDDDNAFYRNETYVEDNGEHESNGIFFMRTP